jgi:hypothetical protein
MTRDDIIRMAREAGFELDCCSLEWHNRIERFAALVAVQVEAPWQNRYLKLMDLMEAREGQPNKPCCLAEREACAKVCEEQWGIDGQHTANEFAAAIRERNKK